MGKRQNNRKSLGELLGRALSDAIEKGVIDGWPEHVTLAVFFGRGDIAGLRDFKLLRSGLEVLRGGFVSRRGGTKIEVEVDGKSGLPIDALPHLPRKRRVMATDRSRNQHPVSVDIVDVSNISAAGTPLSALGLIVGVPKLELPERYTPDRMSVFFEEQPELSIAYLKHDARIPPLVYQRYKRFCSDKFGITKPPRTLGSLAVTTFQQTLARLGIDSDVLFGKRVARVPRFSKVTGRTTVKRERLNTFAMQIVDQAGADAYHGGRTETYITGPISPVDGSGAPRQLLDVDLRNAYPTAMAACRVPGWGQVRIASGEA